MKTAVYGGRGMNAMKSRDRKKLWIMLCAMILLLCLPLLPASPGGTKAAADSVVVVVPVDPDNPEPGDNPVTTSVKNESNTTIGTLGIPNPVPIKWRTPTQFSYVYYGRYGGTPTRYRVLDRDSWNFGVSGGSLLLDCDSALFPYKFDLDNVPNEGTDRTSDWAHSDIKALLNNTFLHSDAVFTAVERSAIAASYKAAAAAGDGSGWRCLQFTPLNGEKIFLLDNAEASRISYGYGVFIEGRDDNASGDGRIKDSKFWMLRSPYYWEGSYLLLMGDDPDHPENNPHEQYDKNGNLIYYLGTVWDNGIIGGYFSDSTLYVCPAFNVARSQVLFSTLTSAENREYKLTLLDDSLSISVPEGQKTTQQGNTLTVPYVVTGNPNKLSVLVTNKEYSDPSATILAYRSADCTGGAGALSITLPFAYTDTVHMYLLAERDYGDHYTDYASSPLEIQIQEQSLVTFDANGGEVSPAQAMTGTDGRLDSLPEPVWEGMYFDGWYDPQASERVTTDTVFTADCTVYAHWIPPYAITFDANGGSVTVSELLTDRNGQLYFLPEPIGERMHFDGWYTDPQAGDRVTTDTVFFAECTVYAHWIPAYTITFVDTDGETSYELLTNRNRQLANPIPVLRDEVTKFFTGWYTEPENGEAITASTVFSSDCTVYAHWKPACVVTLDANGGEVSSPVVYARKDGFVSQNVEPTRDGYNFDNWYTAPEGGEKAPLFVYSDCTFYAHWVPIHTVTFNANGGTISQSVAMTEFYYLDHSEIPYADRSGYLFTGWFTSPEGGKEISRDPEFYIDTTLYAHWETDRGYSYMDRNGRLQTVNQVRRVKKYITKWPTGWYVADDSIIFAERLTVSGDVNLILCDGVKLTANHGIRVPEGSSLSIWVQTAGTGELIAKGNNAAGIGGNLWESSGNIQIYGGNISATATDAAGIGGGSARGNCGEVTIYGGTIHASSTDGGAGIGGGGQGSGGIISIYGGTVYASGLNGGAGIGGGGSDIASKVAGSGGTVIIRGGQVYVTGRIGPGYNTKTGKFGAGGTVELSWSGQNDSITAGSIMGSEIKLDRPFRYITADGSYKGPVTLENLPAKDPDYLIVPDIGSAEISFSEENLLMYAGEERTLRGEVQDDAEGTWEWTIDNSQTATVSGDSGNVTVTALSPGTAVITAYYSSDQNSGVKSADVTVVPVPVLTTAVENGSVTAEPANPLPGDTVILTFIPEGEFTHLDSPVVTCDGEDVETAQTGLYTRTFTMPYGDVNVSAAFSEGGRYVVRFVNADGQILHWDYYTEGTLPTYDETPVYGPFGAYSFIFTGWDREIEFVTEDTQYMATYDIVARSLPVSFTDWNGDVLWSGNVTWGETPTYEGAEPTRPSDEDADYSFLGWTPEIGPVTGETVYQAVYKAAPILRQGQNTVALEKDETVSCSFTPSANGYYRFHIDADPAFCELYILDGNTRIAEGVSFTTEEWEYMVDCAVELEGNHQYTLELLTNDSDTELTLYAEPADVYSITVIQPVEHGSITRCAEQAYAGQMLFVGMNPEEGYWLKKLVVTDSNGNEVKTDRDCFTMPSANVAVTAVFAKQMPITVNMEGPYFLETVGVDGLMSEPETPVSIEGAQVEMIFRRMEDIEGGDWTEEEEAEWQNETFAITVTGEDGTAVDCESSKQAESRTMTCRFIMPDEPVTVQMSRYEEIPPFGTADFKLPANTRTIEESAFEMNVFMTSAEIPAGCESIGRWAFRGCVNLARIRIPAECTVGADAFEGCYKVYVYGTSGSPADIYCRTHSNCQFVEE